jgi:acyl carrier protein
VLNPGGRDIDASTTLVGDLGAESIDFLDISCELEKLLDTEIDFRKLFKARRAMPDAGGADLTVQDIVDCLSARVG